MLFLPITMILYKIGGLHLQYKNIVLLAASIFFYAWGEPIFVFVLLFGVCVNYLFGRAIERARGKQRKTILILSLVFNLGILFVFKYLSFTMDNLGRFFPVPEVNFALPIGISFYTFQIMSYIFDVYGEKVPAQRNLLHLALYISMFPQLVAGPIVRYSDISEEIRNRQESSEEFVDGVERFIVGLAKKVLIADMMGKIADSIFAAVGYASASALTAWIGALAYTFEIYYDFSGYSDMAIGLGLCFGFHFKENFRYPYAATSVTEFWRRWHISLTDWFRDYVYIPMGGNRVSAARNTLNLLVVWLLTGIWHGADWSFVLWGLLYFIIQLAEKRLNVQSKIPAVVGYFITALTVTLCWVVFRAESLGSAGAYLKTMFCLGVEGWDHTAKLYLKSSAVIFLLAYLGSLPLFPKLKGLLLAKGIGHDTVHAVSSIYCAVILALSLAVIISGSYSPFIYFNF